VALKLSHQLQRRLSHGSNATIVTFLVVALVVLLFGVADRHRVRLDVSIDRSNTLLENTQKKLSLLDSEGLEVRVTAFTAQQGKKDSYFKNRALKDLLRELDHQSTVVVTRLVNFDRERLTAEALGVSQYGHMVIQRGDDRVDLKDRDLFRRRGKGADRKLEFLGEAGFARAASQLLDKRKKRIYALRGHGELDPDDRDPDGLSELARMLEQENYELEPLDFIRDREGDEAPFIPPDASAVLLAGSVAGLTPPEEDALVAYIARGGAIMVWVDPNSPVPDILDRIGIQVRTGVVADKLVVFPYPDRPVPRYRYHEITTDLSDRSLVTVLAHIAPLAVKDPAPSWARYRSVLETSRNGWIERGGPLDGGMAVYQPDLDGEGPAVMAYAVELQPDEEGLVKPGKRVSRVLVVGDSDWATNGLLAEGPGNATFAVNAFRWLLWDDARLSIVGQPTRIRRLALTERDQTIIRWTVLGLMPMLVMLVGMAVWASRRGR
jgi:hypothetical protein